MSNDVFETAARLRGRPGRVVLHSGRSAGGLGQSSMVACDPFAVLTGRFGDVRLVSSIGSKPIADPVGTLQSFLEANPQAHAIGYLGYDIGASLADIKHWDDESDREPDIWFGFYDAVWTCDRSTERASILGRSEQARTALGKAIEEGSGALGPLPSIGPLRPQPGVDDAYRAGFCSVKEYLLAGDCYQVNLSRRLVADVREPGDPLALLARLCRRNPEPYAALIETGSHTVVSASPERFLYRTPRSARLETRPIKGTRARVGDASLDAVAVAELRASEKEAAEHLMIVDLERNDLGRVAETGSVRVEELASIAELPTLFHMVSTVSCQLRDDVGLAEILEATFPGGSITGAPKRRAMEIIRELEPGPRGVYTGAIGVFGPAAGIDLSIAIRTAVLCENSLSLHVGGGIVADSNLEREMDETDEKAMGWHRALGDGQAA